MISTDEIETESESKLEPVIGYLTYALYANDGSVRYRRVKAVPDVIEEKK